MYNKKEGFPIEGRIFSQFPMIEKLVDIHYFWKVIEYTNKIGIQVYFIFTVYHCLYEFEIISDTAIADKRYA